MNVSQSPFVTSAAATRCGCSSVTWRGPSLSYAKPSPAWPISTTPPSWSRQPDAATAGAGDEQLEHGPVDVPAVVADLGHAGAGDQAALGPGVLRPDGLVVRVEQHAV